MEYRVTVRGRLSDRLVARLDGLTVVSSEDTTVLAGDPVDQAQLHGILDRIRDLGLELVSVERCPSAPHPAGDGVAATSTLTSRRDP